MNSSFKAKVIQFFKLANYYWNSHFVNKFLELKFQPIFDESNLDFCNYSTITFKTHFLTWVKFIFTYSFKNMC